MSREYRLIMQRMIIFVITLFLLFSIPVFADENYPEGPIKFIVPFGAGGGSDLYVRMLTPHIERELGTKIIIENHLGAGSQVGLSILYYSKPDGYTVGTANQINTSYTIMVQDAPYTIDSFDWMNLHMDDPLAFSVLNEKPWNDLKELIEYIKEHPGEIAFGAVKTSGNYPVVKKLIDMFELDCVVVPYDGSSQAKAAVIGGHIDVCVAPSYSSTSLKGKIG